jgi:2-methylcitrate dehydratase PrpD
MVAASEPWRGPARLFWQETDLPAHRPITVEGEDIASIWCDLGRRLYIHEQYVKFWPVCRWAQPAIEATLALADRHQLTSTDIERVEVSILHEAKRLAMREPATIEKAQCALPWPVAAALGRG